MKILVFLVAVLITLNGFSQPRKSPHDTVSTKNITVTYGRPSMHERVIFGQLVKYGQVWRVGADEATTITFNSETKMGDKEIPAGTYTLFALVNENEWTIILNSVLGQWGSFSYEKNKENDIAHIVVPVTKTDAPVEQLTIRFDDNNGMIIEWEMERVRVNVKPKD